MSDAKVEQRHRDRAKQFVHDYSVRDCFGAREAPIEELAQDYANAEAAGYAAGVKDEREECAKLVSRYDGEGWLDRKVWHEWRTANGDVFAPVAAAIRARSDAQEVNP